MEKKRGVALALSMVTVVALALCAIWAVGNEKLPSVVTVPVTCQDIYYSILVSGTVEAEKSHSYTSAEVAMVDKVYVQAGQTVRRGDKLFTLVQAETSPELTPSAIQDVISTFASPGSGESQVAPMGETIFADMDGTVVSVPSAGQSVIPGIAFCQVADLNHLSVAASVPELYAAKVGVGQKANIAVTANPDLVLSGRVQSISPYAVQSISLTGEQKSASVQAVLSLSSDEQWLRPGYSATVKIFTDEIEDALLVPYAAVHQDGTQEYVLVCADGIVQRQDVTSGYMLENAVEIREGLSASDEIIVSSSDAIAEGQEVQVAA